MNADRTISDEKQHKLAEFSTGHRVAGVIALAFVALFGTVQWMQVGHEQPGEAAQNEARTPTPTPVEYYPTQVTN